ncbi:unnamed protein product, partial [marine sediment metagenome]
HGLLIECSLKNFHMLSITNKNLTGVPSIAGIEPPGPEVHTPREFSPCGYIIDTAYDDSVYNFCVQTTT